MPTSSTVAQKSNPPWFVDDQNPAVEPVRRTWEFVERTALTTPGQSVSDVPPCWKDTRSTSANKQTFISHNRTRATYVVIYQYGLLSRWTCSWRTSASSQTHYGVKMKYLPTPELVPVSIDLYRCEVDLSRAFDTPYSRCMSDKNNRLIVCCKYCARLVGLICATLRVSNRPRNDGGSVLRIG